MPGLFMKAYTIRVAIRSWIGEQETGEKLVLFFMLYSCIPLNVVPNAWVTHSIIK